MLSIVLMSAGALAFVIGLIMFTSSSPVVDTSVASQERLDQLIALAVVDGNLTVKEKVEINAFAQLHGMDASASIQEAELRLKDNGSDAETEVVDLKVKNGLDFEKYVVQRFDTTHFHMQNWAGDKYVEGVYSESTLYPDLLLELRIQKNKWPLYVECKWRARTFQGALEFSNPTQLARYQQVGREKNIPVFMALGLGGKGSAPEHFYIVPLANVKSHKMTLDELKPYEKDLKKGLYYDIETLAFR